ncbi:MAG: uroporphyrinogen decarboxylase [Desulfuromonadales bacterium]|uniref:uroporphyrinogen decarboxylase n=1 Tax=Desulfuromonas sp. KJ2020 TaxID=2919173 RepID=UPI0003213826|nr:uroporphyrinogen decarboxylase [Desulfuromonas sp. KJ2020]MCP3176813.1 uroporphyrinogen decarboxylase [Desulfuromonas sp. KJ2020]
MTTEYNFIKACWGQPVDRTPVWLMRQAGRYLPQYMEVRKKVSFLELCKTPELAAEVTIQPIDYLGADAAILFSDILTPVEPMGLKLDFVPGPVFENPVRTKADIDALRIPVMEEDVPYVLETIKILRREFEGRVPLIGFGGAPFTLACYMVEGKGSKDFAQIKRMMYGAPELYAALMDKVTEMDRQYLNAQIAAGAQAIQIFDTWGGIVSPLDYEKYILPYTTKLINGLNRQDIPIIHFVKGSGTMLDSVKKAGSDVVGLDWHLGLGKARDILGAEIAVQGNLDPTVLYAPKAHIETEVKRILDENAGRPGHIFNLGHGILPTVDPEHAKFMVDCVHRLSQK